MQYDSCGDTDFNLKLVRTLKSKFIDEMSGSWYEGNRGRIRPCVESVYVRWGWGPVE